jgi:farnesyl diphosphate synthase
MATAKAERRAKFEAVFSKIRDELIEHFSGEGMPQEAIEWYRNVRTCSSVYPFILILVLEKKKTQKNLNYNVPGGKLNRGMSVVDTVEILKGRELSDDEYFKAGVLGWSVELVSYHL